MNKKAVFRTQIEEFIIFAKLLLVIILSVGFILVVNNYVNRDVNAGEVSSFVFANGLLDENCFGKNNEFGVIDMDKVVDGRVDNCLQYNSEYLSAKVNILDREIKYNNFDAKETLCWQEKYKCNMQSMYVLAYENNEVNPVTMYVEVITLE